MRDWSIRFFPGHAFIISIMDNYAAGAGEVEGGGGGGSEGGEVGNWVRNQVSNAIR